MRHQRVINHLGRTSSHRKAMLANMASSLILHKRITTTTAKAKALRTYVEPLITKSKEDSTHSRRMVFSYLKDKQAVAELFREISPKIAERPGGYTRILKIGNRIGDNADMCVLELVDYNENMLGGEVSKAKTTRRKRTTKKKTDGETEKAPATKKGAAKVKKSEAPAKEATESAEETTKE
jgi:large subunit ribosomal protein L17